MPDIFVPMDSSSHFRYYNQLRRNNIVYNFVIDYIDKNREKLGKQFSDFNAFNQNFSISTEMVNAIVDMGEKEGIEKNEESLSFTLSNMKNEVKAYIARDLFSRNDFYKIINQDDEIINKALEVIKNQDQYNSLLVSSNE